MRNLIARAVLLLAVLLMPLGMTPATANIPSNDASAGMPMGHCDQQAPRHDGKSGIAECTMACSAALPASVSPREDLPPVARPALHSAIPAVLHGLHPDTATPPPKRA